MLSNQSFFLFRRPLYSVDSLTQFHRQATNTSLNAALRTWYRDPLAQEAIYIASPSLYERFQRWLAGESLSEENKLLTTLYKYVIRMSTRCTPYGLFAGCGVGTAGSETRLHIPDSPMLRKHTRLDIECLVAVKDWVSQHPAVRYALTVYPNSSLYSVGEAYRYVEQQHVDQERHYFISAVQQDEYLVALLDKARSGATLPALTALLTDAGFQYEDAAAYVDSLVENNLLVFDIEPTITGGNYLDGLLAKLNSLPNAGEIIQQLLHLQETIRQPDNRISSLRRVRELVTDIGFSADKADFIQVDTFFEDTDYQLSEKALQHIQRDMAKLLVLNQPANCADLDDFKQRFYDRYEDEEVTLALALDHEAGIGYGMVSPLGTGYAPMVDTLSFPVSSSAGQTGQWGWWENFVMTKYVDALKHGQPVITLTDHDLTEIGKNALHPPQVSSFHLFGNLLAESAEAIDAGRFLFNLIACKGPSGVNMLSRFCEGSEALSAHVSACLKTDQAFQSDAILAEIVHCPESRAGNIMTRSVSHDYEIPYMGQSSVDAAHQIPLHDLYVSIQQGQIVLRSKRLNRRIMPRLSNMHNYAAGLPIYRFLCDLQHAEAHLSVGWNWSVLKQQPYLPQIRYRNIIVSRAHWQLTATELTLTDLAAFRTELHARQLPERFLLAAGDNELLIDTTVPVSLQLLIQEVKKSGTVQLREFLFTDDHSPVAGSGQRFTQELVIPLLNQAVKPINSALIRSHQSLTRRFSIGSEWLYLKVYTGKRSSDTVLSQLLFPVIQQLLNTRIISRFFYVRYKDPEPHIRLRFEGNPHVAFYHHVIRAVEQVLAPLVQSGVVHRIQTDTYQREIERYGADTITVCEEFFHHDSLDTLTYLHESSSGFDEPLRFTFAIQKIDRLLTWAGLTVTDKHRLIQQLSTNFFHEFKGDTELRRQLNTKFRFYKPLIEQALKTQRPALTVDVECALIDELKRTVATEDRFYALLGSLIHMSTNRIFPYKQRAYELILYHCLAKQYESVHARTNAGLIRS